MNITILGAGAFGSALGRILKANGHNITYYTPNLHISLKTALKNAETIVLAVPSSALPDLLPKLPKNLPLIIATKGILNPDYLFKDFNDFMVLSGPGFAADIDRHLNTKLTATDQRIVKLFGTDWLTFDTTTDKKGVCLCGALKNVYAIYAGLRDLKPYTEAHENYLKSAATEMKSILFANHADPNTVDLVCGQGDLRITCNYPSRNYEFGQKLITNLNYQPEKTVEGVTALKRIKAGENQLPDSIPILTELIKISDNWA